LVLPPLPLNLGFHCSFLHNLDWNCTTRGLVPCALNQLRSWGSGERIRCQAHPTHHTHSQSNFAGQLLHYHPSCFFLTRYSYSYSYTYSYNYSYLTSSLLHLFRSFPSTSAQTTEVHRSRYQSVSNPARSSLQLFGATLHSSAQLPTHCYLCRFKSVGFHSLSDVSHHLIVKQRKPTAPSNVLRTVISLWVQSTELTHASKRNLQDVDRTKWLL